MNAITVHPVDERLPVARLAALGLQHVLVMYAGAVAVPLIVGRALQNYGAFCMDQGGARMAFGFENPIGDTAGDPYPGVGFSLDYYAMKHLPWDKLQLLRQWDGK